MDRIQLSGGLEVQILFEGRVIDTMPKLIEAGFKPAPIPNLMSYRLAAGESENEALAEQWERNHYDSGSTILYHSDGRVKIVTNSETLRGVNRESDLGWHGSLELPDGTFDATEGFEFSREGVEKYANKPLTREEVLDNPIWLALADGDYDLLERYTNKVFSRLDSDRGMEIWISNAPERGERERLWSLGSLTCGSDVNGSCDGRLDFPYSRLVGVALKAHKAFIAGETSQEFDVQALRRDVARAREEGIVAPAFETVLGKYDL